MSILGKSGGVDDEKLCNAAEASLEQVSESFL